MRTTQTHVYVALLNLHRLHFSHFTDSTFTNGEIKSNNCLAKLTRNVCRLCGRSAVRSSLKQFMGLEISLIFHSHSKNDQRLCDEWRISGELIRMNEKSQKNKAMQTGIHTWKEILANEIEIQQRFFGWFSFKIRNHRECLCFDTLEFISFQCS